MFKHVINYVHTQFKVRIKCFHMDRGSEYTNDQIIKLFHDFGIRLIYISVDDSASKSLAEHANLTFLNDCRCLLNLINSKNNFSPIGKAGLLDLDATTILLFGHEVVIYNTSTYSKQDAGEIILTVL